VDIRRRVSIGTWVKGADQTRVCRRALVMGEVRLVICAKLHPATDTWWNARSSTLVTGGIVLNYELPTKNESLLSVQALTGLSV
jgi:hypothetical protein